MADYTFRVGATRPSILTILTSDGMWVDLSTATSVKFYAEKHGVTAINGTACTVVTPTTGLVRFDPPTGGFTATGTYTAYFKVTWGDSSIQYFPSEPYIIEVVE